MLQQLVYCRSAISAAIKLVVLVITLISHLFNYFVIKRILLISFMLCVILIIQLYLKYKRKICNCLICKTTRETTPKGHFSNKQISLLHLSQPPHLLDSSFIQAKIQRRGVGLINFLFLANVKHINVYVFLRREMLFDTVSVSNEQSRTCFGLTIF